jgi:hypothetical protein
MLYIQGNKHRKSKYQYIVMQYLLNDGILHSLAYLIFIL